TRPRPTPCRRAPPSMRARARVLRAPASRRRSPCSRPEPPADGQGRGLAHAPERRAHGGLRPLAVRVPHVVESPALEQELGARVDACPPHLLARPPQHPIPASSVP